MTKFTFAALTLGAALWAPAAFADPGGSCHFHGKKPATETTVSSCAVQRKDNLVKTGKLDAAWSAIQPTSIEAVDGKKGKEWKVTFKDATAKDKSKETLYMFFTLPGNFIAANFTGQ
jgi:type 1 fimbria pilin